MSRLFLLRLSFISFKKIVNTKLNFVINLSIFVIVFALTASFISILFEDRIEELEVRITRSEINQILYTKWLNRTPKIISQINNVYQSRKDEGLFSTIIISLPDDGNDETSTLYSTREQYYGYYFFISNLAAINFKNMDLALTDAVLLSNEEVDIKIIKSQKIIFANLINEFDKNRFERLEYEKKGDRKNFDENYLYYLGYSNFVERNFQIIQKQKVFFLDFATKYFSNKRDFFVKKNLEDLIEIDELANLETKFIFLAFSIQFIIFIILQIFEVTIERERKNEKK